MRWNLVDAVLELLEDDARRQKMPESALACTRLHRGASLRMTGLFVRALDRSVFPASSSRE